MGANSSFKQFLRLTKTSLAMDAQKAKALGAPLDCPESMRDAVDSLRRDGIAVLPGYLSVDRAERFYNTISEFVSQFETTTTLKNGVKVNFRGAPEDSNKYQDAGAVDAGMIDVFDIDAQVPELSSIKSDQMLADIVRHACGIPVSATSLHAYINRSVGHTRGYHMDSGQLQYKAFVYLTDVNDTGDGPYSYVRRSHRSSVRKYVNMARNLIRGMYLTEMSEAKAADTFHAIAPKGTLIISDQNGWHRGLRQQEGRERMLLSISFTA